MGSRRAIQVRSAKGGVRNGIVWARPVRLERRALPDLLMHYLLNVAPGSELAAKHYVDRQIEGISAGSRPRPVDLPGLHGERPSVLGPDGA